jgi:hypothetical protein
MALTCRRRPTASRVDYLVQNKRAPTMRVRAQRGAGHAVGRWQAAAVQVQAGEKIHLFIRWRYQSRRAFLAAEAGRDYRLDAATAKIANLSFPIQGRRCANISATGPMPAGDGAR